MTSPKTVGVLTLREITWLAIQDALERNDGNKTRAAVELGIGRTTLFRWIREMNRSPFKKAKQ
jgi:transcriptional regulator with PAS, ATPase and Fis domain